MQTELIQYSVKVMMEFLNMDLFILFITLLLFIYYNRLSLIGTPGDRLNMFVLTGIRINRSHLHAFI